MRFVAHTLQLLTTSATPHLSLFPQPVFLPCPPPPLRRCRQRFPFDWFFERIPGLFLPDLYELLRRNDHGRDLQREGEVLSRTHPSGVRLLGLYTVSCSEERAIKPKIGLFPPQPAHHSDPTWTKYPFHSATVYPEYASLKVLFSLSSVPQASSIAHSLTLLLIFLMRPYIPNYTISDATQKLSSEWTSTSNLSQREFWSAAQSLNYLNCLDYLSFYRLIPVCFTTSYNTRMQSAAEHSVIWKF